MVVLKGVPLWFRGNLFTCLDRYYYTVFIGNSYESVTVILPHIIQSFVDLQFAFIFDNLNEFIIVWRISNALEEFNALLPF